MAAKIWIICWYQNRAVKSFLAQAGPLIIAYLIATSLRDESSIAFKVSSFEASIPAAYFLFVSSLAFMVTCISFNQVSAAITLRSTLAGKMRLPGFSINAYQVIQEEDETGLGIPSSAANFFKEVIPFSSIVSVLLSISLFSFLIPFGAIGVYFFTEQMVLLRGATENIAEKAACIFGLISIVTSVLIVLFFHMPTPHRKNVSYIRWNFLFPVASYEAIERWKQENK